MKNIGNIFLNFAELKKLFHLPHDAVVKNIHVNSYDNEIQISYFTSHDQRTFSEEQYNELEFIPVSELHIIQSPSCTLHRYTHKKRLD